MAKKNTKLVRCINCKHAALMQWFNNPVIAECSIKNERFVAQANSICQSYEEDKRQKEIKHYNSY